jgi:hypothetical protein
MEFSLFLKKLIAAMGGKIVTKFFIFGFILLPVVRAIFLGIFFPTVIDPTTISDVLNSVDTLSNLEIEPEKDISPSSSEEDKSKWLFLFLGAFSIFSIGVVVFNCLSK